MKNSDFFKSVTCATSSHPRLEEGGPQQPLTMIMLNHDVFTGRYWLQGMTSVAVATNAIAEMVPDITRGWNGKVQKWKKRWEGKVMRKHGLEEGQSSRSPILNHEDGVLKGGGKGWGSKLVPKRDIIKVPYNGGSVHIWTDKWKEKCRCSCGHADVPSPLQRMRQSTNHFPCMESSVISICWCITELSPLFGDSDFSNCSKHSLSNRDLWPASYFAVFIQISCPTIFCGTILGLELCACLSWSKPCFTQ